MSWLMFDVVTVGILLILAGFAVVVIGTLTSAKKAGGEVKGAGVVMIGPIPIVFGSDAKWASVAIVLAIVLVALSLLYHLV